MPLYRIQSNQTVQQIKSSTFAKERQLQRLVEKNSLALLGVHFIASEFQTGNRQRGRIDTLGIDQDGSPTIIEYKKTSKDNVINQGLFYLDWLVDHKGDFTLAAQQIMATDFAVDWSNPRLILIAENFTEYDKYAVNRIGANIELWIYRLYGPDLLYLEQIYASIAPKPQSVQKIKIETEGDEIPIPVYTVNDHLQGKPEKIVALFEQLRERIFTLGDDEEIVEKANKLYIRFKHGKNFCEVKIQQRALKMWLDIPFEELRDPYRLAQDVRGIGHHGTGDVAVRLEKLEDLDNVMALIEQAYQQTV